MTDLPDFEAIYRGEPTMPGVDEVPWNIGEPQPALAAVIDAGEVSSPVLDAGCGVGVTTRELARRGYEAVGLDAAASAIEQARHEAARAGLDAKFAVADLPALAGYDGRFATVVDSAVLHALDADRQRDYVRALARACRPGAVLHLLVFTDDPALPDDGGGVNGVTEAQLRDLVGEAFTVERLEASTIATTIPPEKAPSAERDTAGRALFPAWLLLGRRV